MDNEPLKYCKDCKHYRPMPPVPFGSDRCHRTVAEAVDLVSGEKCLTGTLHPREERRSDDGCGPSARYFEKRWTFWKREG